MKLTLIRDPEFYRLQKENEELKEALWVAKQRLAALGAPAVRFLATEPPETITLPDTPDITLRLAATAEAVPYKDRFGWHVVGKWRGSDGSFGAGYFVSNLDIADSDKRSLLMMLLERLAIDLIHGEQASPRVRT
jgi:hypothetical protein